MTTETIKKVPAAALTFRWGEFEFAESEAGAKTFPFTMKARSGGVINHWYWGRVIHDMAGMQLRKASCPIDYCHNDSEVIGVGEKFDAGDDGLTVSGQLVALSADASDRAFEVAHKAKNRIPYEASIDWRGPGALIEEVGEGVSVQVNGQTIEGPLTVIRKWPLRAVAVCPYGSDSNTSTQFSETPDGDMVTVCTFSASGDNTVTINAPKTPNETSPAAASQQHSDKPAPTGLSLDTLKQFNDAFGTKSIGYLQEGLTFDQASLKFKDEKLKALEDENKQLKDAATTAAAGAAQASEATKLLAEKVLGEPNAIQTPATGSDGKKKFADLFRIPGSK